MDFDQACQTSDETVQVASLILLAILVDGGEYYV